MGKFPKCRLAKINAARKAARRRAGKVGEGSEKVEKRVKASTRARAHSEPVKTEPVEIPVNGYSIYHFPNLGLFVKARYETWLSEKGYQPSKESLMPVSQEFVSNVLTAKIMGEMRQ